MSHQTENIDKIENTRETEDVNKHLVVIADALVTQSYILLALLAVSIFVR